jgi:hypothetical protein
MSEVRDWLYQKLWKAIIDNDLPVPSKPTMDVMLSVGEQLCIAAEPEVVESCRSLQPRVEYPPDHPIVVALREATYIKVVQLLYDITCRLPRTDGPFYMPLIRVTSAPSFIYDCTRPFRELTRHNVLQGVLKRFNMNMALITEEFQHKKEFRTIDVVTPQKYPKADFERYLAGTPLMPLAQLLVPYQPFSEINRCAHHWCLGKTRRGKTTFLRHLIKYDLEEAAKGNCSVVVIDSKTLIEEMRTLQQFEPDGRLNGKLILIDSDYPFPLNPFHLPKEQAKTALLYMLGNLSDATERQAGALGFYINAVLSSRNKSLQQLLDYMRLPTTSKTGEHLPKEIANFDKQTEDWFRNTRKTLHTGTSGGIEQRLAEFLDKHADSPIMKMLTADSWGLDLYNELHKGGKVLLVDTDWLRNGPEGANLMGRLFIALIEQLATRRMKNPDRPVWVYIDEASDYLNNDQNFKQILIKAAAAKVGMTVAYQYRGLVDEDIEKALKNAEIQSECVVRGQVELSIEERPMTLPVSLLEFIHEPQMGREEYKHLRESLASRYPYKASLTVEPKSGNDEELTQKY